MSDRRKEIDQKFYKGGIKPIAYTVGELMELLSELPCDLPIMPDENGAALVVYNVKTDAFLSLDDASDWEEDDFEEYDE